ncbi:MAG: glycosyltransferase family 4 protein [Vicinamibacterales bacterium]
MRIAIDARAYFQRTGIARYTRGLVHALVAACPRDEFLLLISDHHRPSDVPLRGARVTVQVSTAPWLSGRTERASVGREVRAWGADRFHSIFPPMVVTGVPSVVTVFDLTPLSHPALHQPAVVRAFRSAMPRALAGAAGVVAISRATAAEVARRYPAVASRVRVAGVGLPPQLEAPPPEGRRAGVLYVGTIEPRKNVPAIVEAARRLRARGNRVPVTIVGKPGWGGFDVGAAVAGLPGVRYRGYVDDRRLRALYRRAAVFLYPSRVEGFGLPVLEAMSQGALPLVSPDPALGEVVGNRSLVIDPGDPGAIADAIERWTRATTARAARTATLMRRARRHTWRDAARAVSRLHREMA